MKYLILILATAFSVNSHAGAHFKVGSAVPTEELISELTNVFEEKIKNKQVDSVIVEGHTDARGSDASNLKLSQARAKAAADKLVEMGVARSSITAVGKGESELLTKGTTDNDHAKNRRVVIVVGSEKVVISESKECQPKTVVVEKKVVEKGPKNIVMLGARYDYTNLTNEVNGNTAKTYSNKALVPEISYYRRKLFDSNLS